MRKFFFALVVMALAFAVAAPTFTTRAQDKTLLEIAAGNPDFSTLVAAVTAADPAFVAALGNKDISLTVFAPTNAAFEALLKALNVSAADLLKNTDLLNAVLAYHVTPGLFLSPAVVGLDGAVLGTSLPDAGVTKDAFPVNALAIKVADGKVSIATSSGGTSNITAVDVKASNGVIHVIDAVLVPGESAEMSAMMEATPDAMAAMEKAPSVAGVVVASTKASTPEFTVLLAAVQAADPVVLRVLDTEGPITVFAPTDAAFAAALKALNVTAEALLADKAGLTGILAYHVVSGEFKAATIVAAAAKGPIKVATWAGSTVEISVKDGKVMVNSATVAAADVAASNGVIHVIDAVLLPPAAK